jgi:alpha-amylase
VPFRASHRRHAISPPAATQVGEFWKDDMDTINKYLDSMGTQFSVFDAPLHYNFKQAGEAGSDFDLTKIFEGTVVQHRPIDAVTLVDNVRSCGTMQV